MVHRRSQPLAFGFLVSDLLLTAAARSGASPVRFQSGWRPVDKTPPSFSHCWRQLPLVLLLAAVAPRVAGQYSVDRLRRFREEVVGVLHGTALTSLLVLATIFF